MMRSQRWLSAWMLMGALVVLPVLSGCEAAKKAGRFFDEVSDGFYDIANEDSNNEDSDNTEDAPDTGEGSPTATEPH